MFDQLALEHVMFHAPNLHSPRNNLPWIEAWFEDELLREWTVAVSYHTWWSHDRQEYDAIPDPLRYSHHISKRSCGP
jgi:hypothetical protein